MTAHPGSFCSPEGATDQTKTGTDMVCSVAKPGDRARWRRNGPAPARTPRRRGRRASAASAPLPQVDAGIDPTKTLHPVPPAADAQAASKQQENKPLTDDQIADKIRATYGSEPGKWVTVVDIANRAGLDPEQVSRGVRLLMRDDNFRAEQEPFGHRIGAEDRRFAPVIGGEALHKLSFGVRGDAPLSGAHATTEPDAQQ